MTNFYRDFILEIDKLIQLAEINNKVYMKVDEKEESDIKAEIEQGESFHVDI